MAWPGLDQPASRVGGGEGDAAVVVGLESYLALPAVPGATENAKHWHRYLTEDLAVPIERVKLLSGEKATKERMVDALAEAAGKAEPGGKVWFIFIGHGAPTQDGSDGVLLGADTQFEADSLEQRGIRQSEAVALLERSSAQPVLVVDACFSGRTGGGEVLVEGLQPVRLAQARAPARAVVLAAAAADQYAGPLPGAARPAFSYLVLGALRGWGDGAAGDAANGEVTAEEAVTFANKAMSALVTGRKQEAEVIGGATQLALAKAGGEQGPDLGEMARLLADAEEGFNVNRLVLPELPSMDLGARATMSDVQGAVDLGTLDMEKEKDFERRFEAIQAAERQLKAAQAAARDDVTGEKQMAAWCALHALPEPNPHAKPAEEACAKAKSYVQQRKRLVVAMKSDWTDKVVPFMGLKSRTIEEKTRVMRSFLNAYEVLVEHSELSQARAAVSSLERGKLPPWAGKNAAEVGTPASLRPEPETVPTRSLPSRGGLEYVLIPGGRFTRQGTTHTIPGFELGKTEVTVAQYQACVESGECGEPNVTGHFCNYGVTGKTHHPMNCVSWQDAARYCAWDEGRLPTEWEWEWAAQGRDQGRTYAWGGGDPTASTACWNRSAGTCSVTAQPSGASRDGVMGLSGGVWEWTSSQDDDGSSRILRGGSWYSSDADILRVDYRFAGNPADRIDDVGFRCARGGSLSLHH